MSRDLRVLHIVSQAEPRLVLYQPAMVVGLSIQAVQVVKSLQLSQWVENREPLVNCRVQGGTLLLPHQTNHCSLPQ